MSASEQFQKAKNQERVISRTLMGISTEIARLLYAEQYAQTSWGKGTAEAKIYVDKDNNFVVMSNPYNHTHGHMIMTYEGAPDPFKPWKYSIPGSVVDGVIKDYNIDFDDKNNESFIPYCVLKIGELYSLPSKDKSVEWSLDQHAINIARGIATDPQDFSVLTLDMHFGHYLSTITNWNQEPEFDISSKKQEIIKKLKTLIKSDEYEKFQIDYKEFNRLWRGKTQFRFEGNQTIAEFFPTVIAEIKAGYQAEADAKEAKRRAQFEELQKEFGS